MRARTGALRLAVLRFTVVLCVVISLPLAPAQASGLPARSGTGISRPLPGPLPRLEEKLRQAIARRDFTSPTALGLAAPPSVGPALCPAQTLLSPDTLLQSIPQLSVTVSAPASVSSGDTAGQVYTATVRNGSATRIAYSLTLSATLPATGFSYVLGSSTIVSRTGTIAHNESTGAGTVTWTPTTAFDLGAGESITLTFRLRTACNALSGQMLRVWANYQDAPGGTGYSASGGTNITVGSGNLVVEKSPSVQDARYGDVVTWTVKAKNTGLGDLYSVAVTDTIGSGFTDVDLGGLPATIPTLALGQSQGFTVTARVNSCTNLMDTVQASWSCGNDDGTGTGTNPVSTTADIAFLLQAPAISLSTNSLSFAYCQVGPQTAVVTVTNSGAGLALNFTLDSNLESSLFTVGNVSPGWSYTPATGVFAYTAGAINGNSSVTLTFDLTYAASLCSAASGNVVFASSFTDACGLAFSGPSASLGWAYGGDAPTVSLSKDGPATVRVGEQAIYTVSLSANNVQHITPTITVTDVVPTELTVDAVSATTGTLLVVGQTITWTVDATGSAPIAATMTITTTAAGGGACGAGNLVQNTARASAPVDCPGCGPVTASASTTTAVRDIVSCGGPVGCGLSAFDKTLSGSGEVCTNLTATNTFSFTNVTSDTWATMVFTETLGKGYGGSLPGAGLSYVGDSLSVLINGLDRTAEVSVTATSPQLVLDFSGLVTPTGAVSMTISYAMNVPQAALNGQVSQQFFDWSVLASSCGTFFEGLYTTISRGDLDISLEPRSIQACQVTTYTLSVTGGTPDRVTDSAVVSFTTEAADFATFQLLGYNAYFGTVNVPAVVSSTDTITWTFPSPITATGQISFTLQRRCSASGPLSAYLAFDDNCGTRFRKSDVFVPTAGRPDISLFVTPDSYEVTEKRARWRIYATNVGDGPALNLVITNTLGTGLQFDHSVVSPASGVVTSTTGGPGDDVTWTVARLEPGQQLRIDVYADVVGCTDLTSQVTAWVGCLGDTCDVEGAEDIVFSLAPASVHSSNGQVADLPLCDVGWVLLTTKNSSGAAHIYNLTITETSRYLTYISGSTVITVTDASGGVITTTTAFQPQVVTGTDIITLTWPYTDPNAAGILDDRGSEESVIIAFQVRTDCASPTLNLVQATASADGPCGERFTRQESAITLATSGPDITINKQGRNATTGQGFGSLAIAAPGDTVVWKIDVSNAAGAYTAYGVTVTDTLPANMNAAAPSASATTGSVTPTAGLVVWDIGTLAAGVAQTLWITGTVDGGECAADTTNSARLTYTCPDSGCLAGTETATAWLRTQADLSISKSPAALNQCGGVITVTLSNNGPTATQVILTDTLPLGLVYSGTLPGSSPYPDYITATAGITQPVWGWDTLPNGLSTLVFETRSTASACFAGGSNQVDTSYRTQGCTPLHTASGSRSMSALTPAFSPLSGSYIKTPHTRVVTEGQTVNWTLAWRNSGTGTAYNVVVTDTLGSGYTLTGAGVSSGTAGGQTPVTAGNTVTWTVGTVPPAATWSAPITATVNAAPTDLRDTLGISSNCWGDCEYSVSETAYATANNAFAKSQSVSTATIGDPLVYTITAQLFGDYIYANTLITDTLPQVDSTIAISVTSVIAENTNGANGWLIGPLGGQVITFTTASGDVQGPEFFTATIQGVVVNAPAVDRGDVLVNRADLTYTDRGQPYSFTDSESLTVVEPLLGISKAVASSTGSTTNLNGTAVLTYTISLTNSGTSPAYDVWITDSIPAGISVTAVYAGGSLSGDGHTATWSVGTISHTVPGNTAVVSYTAVLTSAPAGKTLINTATATYTSRAGPDPNERRYAPISDTEQVQVADLNATKSVAPSSSSSNNLSLGDVLTYTLRIEVPAATVAYWPEWRDTLPAGVRFITGTQTLTGSGIADLGVSRGPVLSTTGTGSSQREVVTWYLRPLTNTWQTTTAVVTMTFRTQATGVTPGGTVINWTQTGSLSRQNDARLRWNTTDYGSYNSGNYRQDTAFATSYLGQPRLSVDKGSTPASGSTVGAGDFITYTIRVTNDGRTPAHDVVISDVLPAEVTLTGWSFSSGAGAGASVVLSPTLPASGVITFGLSLINGTDAAPSGAKQVMLTLTTTVSATVGGGLTLLNTAAIPYYDSQAGDGPDEGLTPRQRTYSDGQDSVSHETPPPTGLLKAGSPLTATVGQAVVYTLTVPSPTVDAYLYDVFVTDTLDSRLQPNAVWAGGGVGTQVGINGQVVTATFDYIAANAQATIVVTATVRDTPAVVDGGVIPDSAQFSWAASEGGTQQGPLTSNTVSTTLAIPALVTAKSAGQPVVTLGDRLTYTYTVTNVGTGLAQSVNVSDTLPGANFQYVAGSTNIVWPGGNSTADPSIAGDVLSWTPNATLLGGEVLILTFQADVVIPPPLGQDQVYTNTAEASGQDALGNPIPADNSSHVPGDTDPDDQDTAPVNGAYGELGDFVWYDWDAEGDQDESPLTGIPGVVITLTYDSQVFTTTTNASGIYSFTQLPLNRTFTLAVGPLDGYVNTTPAVLTATLTYASRTDTTRDFGFDAPGQIGDYVWFDQNGDQVQDPWEPPIAGAVITLTYDSTVLTTTTNASGIYLFDNIPVNQGVYTTTIDMSSLPPGSTLTTPGSFTATLTYADPTDFTHDYGVWGPGRIGDLVWYDFDGDGLQDEVPLYGVPGVEMTLSFDGTSITTTTDANGIYTFTHLLLETWTYTVTVGTVPDLTPTTPTEQSTDLTLADPVDETLDFGLEPPEPGLEVAKTLVEPASGIAAISDTITFTVRVTNSGQTVLNTLTLTDTYDPDYLTLTSWSLVPDAQAAGIITWTNSLAPFLPMAPQASFTITLDFHADAPPPGSVGGVTTNTVTVRGEDAYGQIPEAQDDAQVVIENPVVGAAKAVSSTVNLGDGRYTVAYIITVENLGNVVLSSVQVTDDLSVTFSGAVSFTVNSVSSGDFTVNPGYDGDTDTDLLVGTDSLAAGATGTILLTVTVTPGSNLGPYSNQATAGGTSPGGSGVTDLSDDGLDPDPDGDGNPNEPGENDPTPVTFTEHPVIGAAKAVFSVADNGDCTQTVTYTLVVENLGDVRLNNVQVTDDLADTFVGSAGFVVDNVSSDIFTLNPAYTGSPPATSLLIGMDSLAIGQTGTITLTVTVTPCTKLGPYFNQATATGISPSGTSTIDLSDDGSDPDPDGDGNPNEPGENDPTPVTFTENPVIGVAKAVSSVTNNGDGTYTVAYTVTVENLGNVTLNNVQVVDNLASTFSGAVGFTVDSVSSSDFTVNGSYNGSSNTNLLVGTDSLSIRQTGTIQLVVTVTPGSNLGPYNNWAPATAIGPGGTPTSDNSDNGLDPDPDGDGNPNEPGENDPTPVTFTEHPVIGAAKDVASVTNNGDGTFTVAYTITVENLGDIILHSVQVTDDLDITFAGAVSYTVVSVMSSDFTPNPGYDGSTDLNLLTGTDSLAVGTMGTLMLTVILNPGTNPGPYNNSAVAYGTSPAGTTVSDWSDLGINPDPNGNGDPSDGGAEDNATPLQLAVVWGHIFQDTNGNGVEDPGEPPLVGVSVVITDSSGVTQTVATDASGNYTVTVTAGLTTADVDEATIPFDYLQTAGSDPTTVNAPQGSLTHIGDDGYQPLGTLGNWVWWDVDGDGEQDAGEPGIPGVDVVLSDGFVITTTTDASGFYTFTRVPADTYTITIPAYEFQPGGTLYNWVASPQDAAPDDVDSDGHPLTHQITTTLAAGEVDLSNDFGFDIASSYTLTKQLNTVEPVLVSHPLTVTIRITNTGNSWITVLPLRDTYDTIYLTYGYTPTVFPPVPGTWADPDSDDHNNDGVIDWSDLTLSEGDLAPGVSITVIVTFTAKADTHGVGLPNDETEDVAIVHDAFADPDGPGPLPPEPLPTQQESEGVEIIFPTGVVLMGLSGEARAGGVWLQWETANEAGLLGFNVWRAEAGGEWVQLNEELIFAQYGGAEWGAIYVYRDEEVVPGLTYAYLLEVVRRDGSTEQHALATVTALWWLRLPLIAR